jgi:hypothetical protein
MSDPKADNIRPFTVITENYCLTFLFIMENSLKHMMEIKTISMGL